MSLRWFLTDITPHAPCICVDVAIGGEVDLVLHEQVVVGILQRPRVVALSLHSAHWPKVRSTRRSKVERPSNLCLTQSAGRRTAEHVMVPTCILQTAPSA